ncbi:MAG: methyl-accepting chemotaxis protein [Pseudomonadota bacterium]
MLSKLKIGPKLLLAPASVLLLLIVLSAGAYYGLVRQNRSLENIVQQRATRIKAAADLVACANRAHADVYQLLTWMNGSFSPSRIDAQVREIVRRHAAIDKRYISLQAGLAASGTERQYIAQSKAAHARYVSAVADVIDMAMVDGSVAANAMLKAERAFDDVALRLADLSKLEQDLSEQAYRGAETEFRRLTTWLPLLVALSIALSLLVTMAVRKAMLKDVAKIGAAASALAQGDLTVRERVYSKDEIGETARALDASIRNLNATLTTILTSAQSIDDASRGLAAGNADLCRRAQAQATSMAQTLVSMRQLSDTVNRSVGNAELANQLASCAASFATQGGGVVQRLILAMEAIRGSARKVFEIVGVIEAIAFQANVLAVDAALEAVGADGQGARLAAVAGGARALARRSADAAREIEQLIAAASAEIEGGSTSAGEAGASMADIVASALQVERIVGMIKQSGSAQIDGLSGVHQAIFELGAMTRQSSDLVVQAAAASQGLQDQAKRLSKAMASLRSDGGIRAGDAAISIGGAGKNGGGGGHLRLASSRNDGRTPPPERG